MKKILSLFLIVSILISLPLLAACSHESDSVRVWTLNGTTGFGIAELYDRAGRDEAALDYEFTVESDATKVRDALTAGIADIAALPTNLAANLYNATGGDIQILALNTAGVLYLVVNTARVSEPITSLADLAGKTVYVPAQNPYFIAKALFDKAGVSLTLDATITDPSELRNKMAGGIEGYDYAILPEPMVTIAQAGAAEGVTLSAPLSLTEEWDKHFTPGSLVQGCVVARKAFIEENPEKIEAFLTEYQASVTFVKEHPAEASVMIQSAGIFAQAKVAERAIPKCNLIFLRGSEMKAAMEGFLAAMPIASLGGKLPDAGFYYGGGV